MQRRLSVEDLAGESKILGKDFAPEGLGLAASVPKGSEFQVHIDILSLGRVIWRGSI